jgi:hypothetical protein
MSIAEYEKKYNVKIELIPTIIKRGYFRYTPLMYEYEKGNVHFQVLGGMMFCRLHDYEEMVATCSHQWHNSKEEAYQSIFNYLDNCFEPCK